MLGTSFLGGGSEFQGFTTYRERMRSRHNLESGTMEYERKKNGQWPDTVVALHCCIPKSYLARELCKYANTRAIKLPYMLLQSRAYHTKLLPVLPMTSLFTVKCNWLCRSKFPSSNPSRHDSYQRFMRCHQSAVSDAHHAYCS
jgi:hypothetical protein